MSLWKFLGFFTFLNQNFFETVMDLHQLGFIVVYEYEEVSSLILTWFCSEIRSRVFENLWIWFCCWSLAWNPEINRWIFRSSSSLVQNLEILSLFFSKPCFCDRTEFVATGDELGARIAEEVIRWWRFSNESLRIATNFTEFGLDLVLKKLGFVLHVHEFSEFLVDLILTDMREKLVNCFWCGARNLWIPLTPTALYRLTCGLLIQWACDMWTWTSAWQSGLNPDFWTFLQFM